MPSTDVWNLAGEVVEEGVELPDGIFDQPFNEPLIHQAVVTYEANQRKGTASTKTRSEVRGGGRKPWRQKGTGRARHGSIRSPIWAGGGVTFGPKPRSYRKKMNRKARRQALRSALSAKAEAGEVQLIEAWDLDAPSTRRIADLLTAMETDKALLISGEADPILYRSARNIPGVSTALAQDVHIYEVLAHDVVVIDRDGLQRIREVLAR